MSSLTIDTNLLYLQRRLNFSIDKLEVYQGKSTEEIIKAEAACGNPLAVELANEILTNVEVLIEIFQLTDAHSKYTILMNMPADKIKDFLPLMEKEDLIQGLNFFTQNKLLKMLEDIPAEQLVNVVLELFSKEQIIQYMPEKQLDKLLTDVTLDKGKVLENLKSIPPEYLAQMIESVTGEECKDNDYIGQIAKFGQRQYKEALVNMQPVAKQQLVLQLTKADKKLFQIFDADAYTHMINEHKEKPDLVKAMAVIETDEIIKMLEKLPNDLMSIVITQLDTEVFADKMLRENADIIARLLAG